MFAIFPPTPDFCHAQGFPSRGSCRRSRLMRGRFVVFGLSPRFGAPTPPLVTKGRWHGAAVTEGMRRCPFCCTTGRRSTNLNVLIPSVAFSDSFPWSPREAFALCKRAASQNVPPFSSSVSLRLPPSPQGEGFGAPQTQQSGRGFTSPAYSQLCKALCAALFKPAEQHFG